MKNRPRVSAIIPVYNRPHLLAEALNSIRDQTFSEWEAIIVDDGSNDGETAKTANSFVEKDNRFALLSLHHSGFPGKARNAGASVACGEYIAFLDSDDLWLPRKLERQLSSIEKSGDVWGHTREEWHRGERVISQKNEHHKRCGDIFADSLKKCIIGPSTTMIKRRILIGSGGFPEDIEVAEDYEFWLRLTAVYEIDYIDEPLTVKRAGNWDQLSMRYDYIEPFRINALERLLAEDILSEKRKRAALETLAGKYAIHINGAEKRGKNETAEKYRLRLHGVQSQLSGVGAL